MRFPVLVSQHGAVPDATTQALAQLNPQGGGPSGGVQAYSAGGASVPSGLKSQDVPGDSPAEIANSIDQLRQRLTKQEPQHILLVSSDQAGYAMPAAAWAARSGDPVLFTGRNQVPAATLAALRRHVAATVYVIGPESVISKDVVQQVGRVSATVQRVGATGAVQNALLFARYSDGTFGWNINDPGHGMELANADRPLDAAAAASLASSGKWGPLLITDTADALPPELRSFLLDIKPGYETDPTRAVYNHIWLMGDATAIGGQVQAEIDELAELAPIGAGGGGGGAAANQGTANGGVAQPGGLEGEPNPTAPQTRKEEVSEAERPDRLTRRVTVEDIRALAGPSTPHFALQVRNRIRNLIDGLPEDDPVRREGEVQIARLEELAQHSGDPRGGTGVAH